MFPIIRTAIASTVACLMAAVPAAAHSLPDGVIFRGLQLVVREDKLELRYLIGLNQKMVREQLVEVEQPFPTDASDADLLAIYRTYVSTELPKKMMVVIDDKPQTVHLERADIVRQHHADIECVYELEIEPTEVPSKLKVVDNNFKGVPGDHNFAIRGRGGIELLRSDAQVSLTRREPTIGPRKEKPEPPRQQQLEAYYCLPAETK